jgi:hypothetical protein
LTGGELGGWGGGGEAESGNEEGEGVHLGLEEGVGWFNKVKILEFVMVVDVGEC